MPDLTGQTIGQYQIVAVLGQGGMATVYRARQPSMQRDVAVKVIQADLIDKSDFVERFEREARTIASLSHPFILKVFDYGQHEDTVFLAMELLNGGSLSDRMRADILPLESVTRILAEIAEALDYAHVRGVIHRDLKPQNVLLDEAGHAHLSDFGLAKLLTDTSKHTRSGTVLGTPAYMSPEQWSGQPLDARSDIYSLGVILFEMLTGRIPFDGDTPFVLMHKHVYEAPPPVRDLVPGLPPGVEEVVNKALAKDREARFSSAGELAAAFKTALAGGPVASQSTASTRVIAGAAPGAAHPAVRTRRWVIPAAAAGILLMAIVAVIASRAGISTPPGVTSTSSGSTSVPSGATSVASGATSSLPAVTSAPTATPLAGPPIASFPFDNSASTPVPSGLAKITTANVTALDRISTWGRGAISAAAVSRDGHWLATVDNEGLRVFDLTASNTVPAPINGLGGAFRMEFSRDNAMIAALDCTENCDSFAVKTVIIATGEQLPQVTFPRKDYGDMALSPDGKSLVTGSDKDTAAAWDVATGQQRSRLTGVDGVSRIAFSPDGSQLAFGKTDGSVVLWDVKTGAAVATLKGHTQQVTSLAFSPDGSLLASGTDKAEDSSVRLWDVKTGSPLAVLQDTNRNDNPYSLSLSFNPDGSLLAAGSGDTIRLWDAKKHTLTRTLDAYDVNTLAFGPGGAQIITQSQYGGIELLDIGAGKAIAILPQSGAYFVAFSPDGKHITSTVGKYIYLRDPVTGAVERILQGAPKVLWALAYSPDGLTIAGSSGGKVYLWNSQTGDSGPTLVGSDEDIKDLAFNPDGSLLAGASGDSTVRIWDMKTHTTLRILRGVEHGVSSVAFSPDGKILASAGGDKTIHLWDAGTGAPIRVLTGHEDEVTAVRFSPDGSLLASASVDNTVRLWNVATGEARNTFHSDNGLGTLMFTADGSMLLAGGYALKAWDVKTAQELVNLDFYITGFAFSPDGTRIAAAGGGALSIGGVR